MNLALNIGVGFYTVTVALHSEETHIQECYHWIDNAYKFEVISGEKRDFIGICKLNPLVSIKENDE